MKSLLNNLKTLGTTRLLGIAAVGLAVLAIVGIVALRSGSQPMALLYGDLELRDSAQVTAALDKLHVAYELGSGGTRVLVPSDEVDHLRLVLAGDNLPSGGSVGYEIFDRGDSLTSNQFQQQINQLRALEGELERTIRTIRGVHNARVHLVLAKREPFAREQQEAQASIVLAMGGAQRMGDDEVQAIVNLVSAAVPGLKTQNISVVDNRGDLLARSGRSVGSDGMPGSHDGVRRTTEQRLDQAVEDMLGRTLGPGHVRAEATVEMDFDQVKETQERFDPDGQVMRSQQTVTDGSKASEPQTTVSVQNNLPNPDSPSGGANGSTSSHQEENTNYEIGKTVRTVVRDSPSIKRISMAVLVDGITAKTTDGKSAWRELSKAELENLTMLTKSAVGFDDKRGDHVEVVNMRFSSPDEIGDPTPTGSTWLNLGKADVIWLITLAAISIVALFALGFVVRPLALKLATGALEHAPGATGAPSQPLLAGFSSADPPSNSLVPIGSTEQDTMLNIANVEGEVRASSIRKLGDLVENQTDASVTVIRGWLAQGGSSAS